MQFCFHPVQYVHFFPGVGYRPVKLEWIEDQHGTALVPTVAPDADLPYESKYTPLSEACYRHDLEWSQAMKLFPAMGKPGTAITLFPDDPGSLEGPSIAPVPLPDAGTMLILAIGALAVARPAWRAMGRFADWFTSDRGTGPGKCGWP